MCIEAAALGLIPNTELGPNMNAYMHSTIKIKSNPPQVLHKADPRSDLSRLGITRFPSATLVLSAYFVEMEHGVDRYNTCFPPTCKHSIRTKTRHVVIGAH